MSEIPSIEIPPIVPAPSAPVITTPTPYGKYLLIAGVIVVAIVLYVRYTKSQRVQT